MINNSNIKKKADTSLIAAKQIINRCSGKFINFFMKDHVNNQYYEAIELLETAVNSYKLIKEDDKYIESLILKSELEKQMQIIFDYLNTLIAIGNFYSARPEPTLFTDDRFINSSEIALGKTILGEPGDGFSRSGKNFNEEKAMSYYYMAINVCIENNKYDRINNICEQIFIMYDNYNDKTIVINFINNILNNYGHLMSERDIRKIKEHIAVFYFDMGMYGEAKNHYEDIGKIYLKTNIGKYVADKYFYYAILCTLAHGDIVDAKLKLDQYNDQFVRCGSNLQSELINKIIDAIESCDEFLFDESIKYTNQIKKFDNNEIMAFQKIKNIFIKNDNEINEVDLT
jgi:tetratricopeptide (TPR) repeat protein